MSDQGDIVAESTHETLTRRDDQDSNIFEQSTGQSECPLSGSPRFCAAVVLTRTAPFCTVWDCISKACKAVLKDSGITKEQVKGIGFDATCSLAVANINDGTPVSVSPESWTGAEQKIQEGHVWDVILWAGACAVQRSAHNETDGKADVTA